jgi:hypothetical protein
MPKNTTDAVTSMGSWFSFLKKSREKRIHTLTSFVKDTEHELMSVLTTLQGQIDLFYVEQEANNNSVDRFSGMNRSVSRLIADTCTLAYVSNLADSPRSDSRVLLERLIKQVVAETQSDINISQVSVSCAVTDGITLACETAPLKRMCKGLLLNLLHQCHASDHITIAGSAREKRVSISFETGRHDEFTDYKPWRVGQLRFVPPNGDGIKLSAIDAVARMNKGQLSVRRTPDLPDAYKLTF